MSALPARASATQRMDRAQRRASTPALHTIVVDSRHAEARSLALAAYVAGNFTTP
jgi:hypothetical protein